MDDNKIGQHWQDFCEICGECCCPSCGFGTFIEDSLSWQCLRCLTYTSIGVTIEPIAEEDDDA